ncbi:MAG: hypothetical protein ACOH16_12530 [Propionibacteriaceae bacterium]
MRRAYVRRRLLVAAVGLAVIGLVVALIVAFMSRKPTETLILPSYRCVASVGDSTAELNVEQSYYAAIIAGVAVQRGLPPRAVSVALATAFQESDLRNLDYGDRDSVGLFQQRPSQGWGTVEQIMNPHYSTGRFYDALIKVAGWQAGDINDVAQAVQRSGVPDGYRKHVERAKILASALSGETAAAFTCISKVASPSDPAGLAALLKATYGGTAPGTVVPGSPARIEISSATEAATWSVAAASQAWASKFGVSAVRVGEKQWESSATQLPLWSMATPAGAPRTITVSFV